MSTSNSIQLAEGQQLEFPVAADHPLAQFQTARALTPAEVLGHPLYSNLIGARMNAPAAPMSQDTLVTHVIARVGSVWQYQLADITVAKGARLIFHGNFHVVSAGNVSVEDGGVIRVYCDDRTVSPTLKLSCTQLTGPPRLIVKQGSGPSVGQQGLKGALQ